MRRYFGVGGEPSKLNSESVVLVTSCPDRMGVVREVANYIFDQGGGIVRSDQFSSSDTERFFMRCEFAADAQPLPDLETLKAAFEPIATAFAMDWQMHDSARKPKILLAVSKAGHCLNDLLFRWSEGEFSADLVGVVSNHEDLRARVEWHGLPFHYLPIVDGDKQAQEQSLLKLFTDAGADLLVLARYMQILSANACHQLAGRAINIHHSFLPSFKGARPYHQARMRGVKIIGATAHYVTTDLDEGPIIEQDVHRVGHSLHTSEMVQLGQEIESRVLARAVKWHCEHRILLDDRRTVVFD